MTTPTPSGDNTDKESVIEKTDDLSRAQPL